MTRFSPDALKSIENDAPARVEDQLRVVVVQLSIEEDALVCREWIEFGLRKRQGWSERRNDNCGSYYAASGSNGGESAFHSRPLAPMTMKMSWLPTKMTSQRKAASVKPYE